MQRTVQRTTRTTDGKRVVQTTITVYDDKPTDAEIEKIEASLNAMWERGRRQFLWVTVGGISLLAVELLALSMW